MMFNPSLYVARQWNQPKMGGSPPGGEASGVRFYDQEALAFYARHHEEMKRFRERTGIHVWKLQHDRPRSIILNLDTRRLKDPAQKEVWQAELEAWFKKAWQEQFGSDAPLRNLRLIQDSYCCGTGCPGCTLGNKLFRNARKS